MQRFVLHWGEMGPRWGVNRTIAQIHALLFLSAEPLDAETIATTLGVARSNVSTSLKELQAWGLVHLVSEFGERRDRFASPKDVWEIFFTIVEGRRKRELDPTLSTLRTCLLEADADPALPSDARTRMEDTLVLLERLTTWAEAMAKVDRAALMRLLDLGARVQQVIGPRNSAGAKPGGSS